MSKRRGWRGRATTLSGQGWYVDVPPGVGTLVEAQAWAEGWLGCSALLKLRKLGCSPGRPRNARDPDRDRPSAASAEWGAQAAGQNASPPSENT
jgi:hypothetical protein